MNIRSNYIYFHCNFLAMPKCTVYLEATEGKYYIKKINN